MRILNKEIFWTEDTPTLAKSLLYVFLMVGGWSVVNSYNWSLVYVLKETLTIWFVGGLGCVLARMK